MPCAFTEIDLAPLTAVSLVLVGELDGAPGRELVAVGVGQLLVLTEDDGTWVAGEPFEVPALAGVDLVDRDGDGRQELLFRRWAGLERGGFLVHAELADRAA